MTVKNSNNPGGIPPHRLPPHLMPLDGNRRWVKSTQEGKWHFIPDHCRYAPIIDVLNRAYRDSDPSEDQMCAWCRFKWRRHVVKAQKAPKKA